MNLGVIGLGMRLGGEPKPHRDMLYEAVAEALHEAKLRRDQIDTAVTISSDLAEGRSLSNQYTLDSIGGVMRPFDLRLSNESLHGVAAAALQLLSGRAKTALVAGVLRGSDLADGEWGVSRVLAARMNVHYERPILERTSDKLRPAMAELLEREAGREGPGMPPPHNDLAIAVVLKEKGAEDVVVRGIGWHARPGWLLKDYEMSARAAAAAAQRSAGTVPRLDIVEVPAYPDSVTDASLRALDVGSTTEMNPSRSKAEGSNLMMDGLYRFARVVRALRKRKPGTWGAVLSWHGPGSSSTCVTLLERVAGARS